MSNLAFDPKNPVPCHICQTPTPSPARPADEPALGVSEETWRCFHCNEVFTTAGEAALHFGKREHDEPLCQIKRHERHLGNALRIAQETIARYQVEDSDVLRAMSTLEASIHPKVQQAEEEGYARGLKDAASSQAPSAERKFFGVGELERTGYIPDGSAAEREGETK